MLVPDTQNPPCPSEDMSGSNSPIVAGTATEWQPLPSQCNRTAPEPMPQGGHGFRSAVIHTSWLSGARMPTGSSSTPAGNPSSDAVGSGIVVQSLPFHCAAQNSSVALWPLV